MFRKLALGLIAATSLAAAALVPTAASAHGFHGHWGHGGWGHSGFGFGGVYVSTGVSNCFQQRVVATPYGPRVRVVNVCAYY
jgi:Spy/CpxP family protein refolding chaperone